MKVTKSLQFSVEIVALLKLDQFLSEFYTLSREFCQADAENLKKITKKIWPSVRIELDL